MSYILQYQVSTGCLTKTIDDAISTTHAEDETDFSIEVPGSSESVLVSLEQLQVFRLA